MVLDWVVTGIIISGMLLFFSDNLTIDGFWGNMCAIISAICWAVFVLFSRRQKDDVPHKIPILGHMICTLVGAPFIIAVGLPETGWFWIVPMGAIGAGSTIRPLYGGHKAPESDRGDHYTNNRAYFLSCLGFFGCR